MLDRKTNSSLAERLKVTEDLNFLFFYGGV